MNWNKMVKMTVPVGLCGWQQRGSLTINGRTTEFPVGVDTELPEPVAERVKALMADAEEKAEHVQPLKPWMQYVTGADGVARWEPRLAYAYGEMKTILPECTFSEEDMSAMFTPLAEPLAIGKKYKVTWNGTEYMTTAQYVELEPGEYLTGMGNFGAVMGGTDTGEPFIFAENPDAAVASAGYWAVHPLGDLPAAVTIKVELNDETVKQFDKKYIPNPVTYIYIDTVFGSDVGSSKAYEDPECTKILTYAEIEKRLMNGCRIQAKTETFDFYSVFTPLCITPLSIFKQVFVAATDGNELDSFQIRGSDYVSDVG